MELTYGYSAKDILFMQTISTLGSVFGIVPSYDYKKRKLIHKKWYRCYVLLLACFITSCSMASLYYRFKYEMFTVIIKTMDLFVEVTGLVLCLVAVLNSSLWNMKTWNKLIGQLSQLEGPSNLNTRGVRNGSLKRNPLVWFLFGCIFYMFLTLCNFFTMGRAMFVRHITQMVLHYAKFMSMIIMYPITLSIRVKYEDLKEMFVKVEAVIASRKDSVRILRKVRTLCLALDSVVESFNSFFGWPVLLLLAHSFAQFLCCLSILIRRGLRKESLTDFIILCYMIGDLGVIFITISGCDNAMKASRQIFKSCCQLKATLPPQSKEAEELEKLQTTFHKQSKFTAAGFFEINRSLLLSIFSTITTYMIVVIQFNSIKSNSDNNE